MLEKSVVSIESSSAYVLELHEMSRDTCFIKVNIPASHCVMVIISHFIVAVIIFANAWRLVWFLILIFVRFSIQAIWHLICYTGNQVNPLMGTLKPQSNAPLHSNTVIDRLHWPLMGELLHFGTARTLRRAWAGCGPTQALIAVPNIAV